jgi:hypothetical protein
MFLSCHPTLGWPRQGWRCRSAARWDATAAAPLHPERQPCTSQNDLISAYAQLQRCRLRQAAGSSIWQSMCECFAFVHLTECSACHTQGRSNSDINRSSLPGTFKQLNGSNRLKSVVSTNGRKRNTNGYFRDLASCLSRVTDCIRSQVQENLRSVMCLSYTWQNALVPLCAYPTWTFWVGPRD